VDADKQARFVNIFSSWLVSLPFDLRVLYEATSDENLSREARELATGAIIYAVSPNDFVAADRNDFVTYCDDCILVRMAMLRLAKEDDEDSKFFCGRFPEFFEPLADELEFMSVAMGGLYGWLDSKVDSLKALEYKGKKVAVYLDNDEAGEFLYEEGLGFATEYPVVEDSLSDKLKKSSTILQAMQRRQEEESRKTK
jgi:uncharacterized membrane protein YkvA (DUF1232 family)